MIRPKMFNLRKNKKPKTIIIKPEHVVGVKYIGGHPAYPHEMDTLASFYKFEMRVGGGLRIPYAKITKLGGQEDKRITKTRVLMTGIIPGLLWKKIFRYSVIEYHDGFADIAMVLDFHREAEKVHQYIYARMQEAAAAAEADPAQT